MSDNKRLAEHIAALLLDLVKGPSSKKKAFFEKSFVENLSSVWGIECPHGLVEDALKVLRGVGAVNVLVSPLTDDLIEINYEEAWNFFSGQYTPNFEDFTFYELQTTYFELYPVLRTYFQSDDDWIERIGEILSDLDLGALYYTPDKGELASGSIEIPASDRLVSIGDNERSEIISASEEVTEALSKENSVDGDADLRDRFLAQLAAARELMHAQSVRVYLVYETLVGLLETLIRKYQGQVLGTLAKKLLDLVIEHILGK